VAIPCTHEWCGRASLPASHVCGKASIVQHGADGADALEPRRSVSNRLAFVAMMIGRGSGSAFAVLLISEFCLSVFWYPGKHRNIVGN